MVPGRESREDIDRSASDTDRAGLAGWRVWQVPYAEPASISHASLLVPL